MQLGIFAKTFSRPAVEEVFAAVAQHQLRCVQFNFACAGLPSLPDEISSSVINCIRNAARQHRIEIAAVSGTFNMIHPDPEKRQDGLRRLEVIAASCSQLGAKVVTLCTGTRDSENMWRQHPGNGSSEAWRDLVHTLAGALTIAERYGLTLGMEPETGNVVSSARHARQLLDEMKSPRLKIVMDAANLFHAGDLPRLNRILDEAFQLLGSDIVLAHAKELSADGHASDLAVGTGALGWDKYLEGLRAVSFQGPLIMHGFDETEVTPSVKFLRGKLGSATTA